MTHPHTPHHNTSSLTGILYCCIIPSIPRNSFRSYVQGQETSILLPLEGATPPMTGKHGAVQHFEAILAMHGSSLQALSEKQHSHLQLCMYIIILMLRIYHVEKVCFYSAVDSNDVWHHAQDLLATCVRHVSLIFQLQRV